MALAPERVLGLDLVARVEQARLLLTQVYDTLVDVHDNGEQLPRDQVLALTGRTQTVAMKARSIERLLDEHLARGSGA